ncbi:germinal center-associated signaling and motility protein-like [Gracilinanus agilis]|uniref:germinal center-associated signaling and motility protein-like n=1 Tax=Gracilinanus agilis TaxID=191870 RepID=UPI001CFCE69C|nr:germinal center-associated signaling and motility protein-like [Gracilinanus agilis]
MGNCLRSRFRWPKDTQEEHKKHRIENPEQKKFRQMVSIFKRRKKECHKENEEVSSAFYQENNEDNAKEPFYALIMHGPQRRPSMNSTDDGYENVGPRHMTKQLADRRETEYAVLRVSSSPQPPYSFQDEEYELIMPITHTHYPSHLNLINSGNLNR